MLLREIEAIEKKYLDKFYYFLKFCEDEMMQGFQTKEKIKDDWDNLYSSKISNFAVGAERIIYSLFNGKGIGQPNSSPVGADMFFELEDAFIHIDMKTVQSRNIGDITGSIFVGENQNSYKGQMDVRGGEVRDYTPALPTFYNKGKENEKICLSYFITIAYEDVNLNILNINIICMPNGELEKHYGRRVLKAGKNPGKTRFNYKQVNEFELLDNKPSRIRVIYFNQNMNNDLKSSLKLFEDILAKAIC